MASETDELRAEVRKLRSQLLLVAAVSSIALRNARNKDVTKTQTQNSYAKLLTYFMNDVSQDERYAGSELALYLEALSADDADVPSVKLPD